MRSRQLLVPGLAAVAAIVLAGCTGGQPTPSPSPTSSGSSTPTPTATSTLSPEAASAQKTFDDTNRSLAAANASADDEAIVDGLVAAGFDKKDMQITPDTTTIGRAVDSIEVAVRTGDTCLVGQFRGATYVGEASPVLSTGKCLLGTTRAIDW
jgi:hypothetical protein